MAFAVLVDSLSTFRQFPPSATCLVTIVAWRCLVQSEAVAQVDKAQRMLHEVRHLEYQSAAVRGAPLNHNRCN